MDVRAASVLPLKPEPVVRGSKDSSVEDLHKLHDSVVEEPVCKGWVLDGWVGSGSAGVRVVWADESSQLWPLEVCCTVSEEDCRQAQCVDHGKQTTPLTLPILLGAMQTGGVVEYSTGEGLSLSPHHVPQLVQGQLAISWVLSDVHSACLKGTMLHLGVESKETKSWMLGKTTIIVLHQVLEVVADGGWDLTLAEEVSCYSGEKGGESAGEVALSCELIEWNSTNGGPHQRCVGGGAGLTLIH